MGRDRISTVGSHVLERLRGWNPLPDQISFVGLLMSELQFLRNLRSVVATRQKSNRGEQKQPWNEPNHALIIAVSFGREQRTSQGNGRKVGLSYKCPRVPGSWAGHLGRPDSLLQMFPLLAWFHPGCFWHASAEFAAFTSASCARWPCGLPSVSRRPPLRFLHGVLVTHFSFWLSPSPWREDFSFSPSVI